MRTRSVPLSLLACLALLLPTLEAPAAQLQESPDFKSRRVLRVGPGEEFRNPSEAAAVARNRDIIEIQAGVYRGDVAVWRANRLTIRAVGEGRAHLRADGENAQGKAIWVIKGNNTTVEGIEFSGATVPDGNGAGIRQEGRNLTVRNCHFHDNQMGLLAGDHPRSKIVIEHSIFEDSRSDRALAHNIYVNGVKRFILRHSTSRGASEGHNVKSRAKRTDILYNHIADEKDGASSYAIDISNAGKAFIIGNVIQQGEESENSNIVAYGGEGYWYKGNKLFFVHNTVVNDRSSGTFVRVWGDPRKVRMLNNLFVGRGGLDDQETWTLAGNLFRNANPGFRAANRYDYRLRPRSAAVDAGVTVRPPRLRPRFQYVATADREKRDSDGKPDVGAYER